MSAAARVGDPNAPENLTLIKNEPYHYTITNTQEALTKGMLSGDSKIVDWPMIHSTIYPLPGL